MKWTKSWWIAAAMPLLLAGGCAAFPKSAPTEFTQDYRCWDVKTNDQCDYFQYLDPSGRVVALGYDDDRDGQPEIRIELADSCSDDQCPHYVILLDGIPYSLVKQLYDEGGFRLFHPPSRLVSCFPSMTDLAFSQMYTPGEPLGFEALWYNPEKGKVEGGKLAYLSETNAPWQKFLDYRVSMILDAVGYVSPGWLLDQELGGIERTFNRRRDGTVTAYCLGTATVGTRKGAEGLVKALKKVDRLCEKIMYQRRGRCRFTIAADHGHNLTAATHFEMEDALETVGFNPTDRLKDPNDVVAIEFGLVTYSAIYTTRPAAVADAMLPLEPIALAAYVDPADSTWVTVRNRDGSARITRTATGYVYQTQQGDPLELAPIVEQLAAAGKVGPDGAIDDEALFLATVDHKYPDPLNRVYTAFHGLVRNPPNLILTVKDSWFCGAEDLAESVNVASTHGSLRQLDSVTLVMSTIRPLPPAVRIADLLEVFPPMRPEEYPAETTTP